CDALRSLDGLRGLPRHAHARGVGRDRRQPPRRRARPREDGPHRHRRRACDVRRVHGLRRRLDRRSAGVRIRPRRGDSPRRHDRACASRAQPDGDLRPVQLVAPRAGRPDCAREVVASRRTDDELSELTKPFRFRFARTGSLGAMRRLVVIVALGLLVASSQIASASAARNVKFGIQDDAWLADGPGTLQHRLDILQELGVSIVRYTIHWDQVAPTKPVRALASNDPAYRWTAADLVLNGLHERGIEPLVTLYGTPMWANGRRLANAPPRSRR